ncbi:MAG: putative sulfate exporter family transporter, partial [Betaproteobacteria bacterium]
MPISEEWRGRTPGLGMALLLGCLAMLISSQFLWLGQFGLSILTIAILLGFLFGNIPGRAPSPIFFSGFNFAKQKILRLGIILFGFRLTFTDIASVGMTGILIDLLIVTSTFCLTWIIGVRFLGM